MLVKGAPVIVAHVSPPNCTRTLVHQCYPSHGRCLHCKEGHYKIIIWIERTMRVSLGYIMVPLLGSVSSKQLPSGSSCLAHKSKNIVYPSWYYAVVFGQGFTHREQHTRIKTLRVLLYILQHVKGFERPKQFTTTHYGNNNAILRLPSCHDSHEQSKAIKKQ